MRIFRNFLKSLNQPTAVTIGNFDGIHRGHQALLKQLQEQAGTRGLSTCVITFEPHPKRFFGAELPRLTTFHEKMKHLEALGIDNILCLRFNQTFSHYSPKDFFEKVLRDTCQARLICVGEDFKFGARREGDFLFLKNLCDKNNIELLSAEEISDQGQKISSSSVREALAQGNLDLAEHLLGVRYHISGRVIRGDQRGRLLGVHTANIDLSQRLAPMTGVYGVTIEGLGPQRQGVANMGFRPTIGGNRPCLEVHIFDFSDMIYGQRIQITFQFRLRDEKRFDSLDDLKRQIHDDLATARKTFNR